MTILDELAHAAHERIARAQKEPGRSFEAVRAAAIRIRDAKADSEAQKDPNAAPDAAPGRTPFPATQSFRSSGTPSPFPFAQALARPGLSCICEVKRASPSKGLIAKDFDPLAIASDYANAGAAAISVLTEPTRFLGANSYLQEIARLQPCPVLRKDFIIDDYMIYEAKVLGASAVLLICALLDEKTLAHALSLCETLRMDALVEAHDREEIIEACAAGARIIGINNRNLKDFSVDSARASALANYIPDDVRTVFESGMTSASDLAEADASGADAVLIGEAMMRAGDKKAKLAELTALVGADASASTSANRGAIAGRNVDANGGVR